MQRRKQIHEEKAVSEILGVIMMLAMVVSIMGGVFVFLNPYLVAFHDNTNWNSANNIADRIEDRLDVVGDAPNGTGTRQALSLQASSINSVQLVEEWVISADLTPYEVVQIEEINSSSLRFFSINESISSVVITNPETSLPFEIQSTFEYTTIDHNLSSETYLIVDMYNEGGTHVHRWARFVLSGLSISTNIEGGANQIVLINDARISKDPGSSWEIEKAPRLRLDTLVDGTTRLSLVLTDVQLSQSLGSGPYVGFKVESMGPIQLFTGDAHNLRVVVKNTLHSIVDPQYHEIWLTDYTLNRASGTLDEFIGISPYQRASGMDGFTVETQDSALSLEIDVRRMVVNG